MTNRTNRFWILGAADPEMGAIERLLRDNGERVEYATVAGRRVTPATAYQATGPVMADPPAYIYLVECGPACVMDSGTCPEDGHGYVSPPEVIRVDHHSPDDPGYGRPPAEYLAASSLGQVLALLGLEPTPEHRLVAAADHCLAAAYRGKCPGVDPDALMAWRAASRAAFQRRPVAELLADVEATRQALRVARTVEFEWRSCSFHSTGPMHGCPDCDHGVVWSADMRREPPYPELPEAAAREGVGYVAGPLRSPDGRRKFTCSGSPEQVEAFMAGWAPAQGLVDIYGDPARGFAGGYKP